MAKPDYILKTSDAQDIRKLKYLKETQGRVHTSAATVAVLPEAEEFD